LKASQGSARKAECGHGSFSPRFFRFRVPKGQQ
jgi:hypothetical protein